MIVSLIVAMDEERGIGRDGRLPWHLSDDLKRFKKLTMDHHLVMGRKTYQSIGRSLPGRTIIVITRSSQYNPAGYLVAHSLKEALDLARARGETEVFVSGGGEIFAQALPLADRIYLTRVHTLANCDVFFPPVDFDQWVEKERYYHFADDKNDHPFTYALLENQH